MVVSCVRRKYDKCNYLVRHRANSSEFCPQCSTAGEYYNIMKRAADQIVLWIYCLMAAIFIPVDIPFVAAALTALLCACGNRLAATCVQKMGIAVGFLTVAAFCPRFLLFTPVVLYGILETGNYILAAASGGLSLFYYTASGPAAVCFIGVGSLIAAIMQYQTGQYILLEEKYRRTRDDGVEKNLLLREKNQSILKNQDYEVYTATLRERNRIAREIHDNVGHMLSRSILMVGAMKVVYGEGNLRGSLNQLEETLNAAMTSIRKSVHDLHDDAVNMKEVLEGLVKEYTFCQVHLEYDMGYDVPKEIRYGFIAIVKESLHNVMRHSDATQVRIVAREHPGFYQLIVEDNGTVGSGGMIRKENPAEKRREGSGIGIVNMKERVDAFGGHFEIRTDKGWRIYITVPKTEES